MYFYAIVFISILLPLVLKNKKLALRISFFFLFILLGFQFELVQDWGPNIGRWQYVNEGAGEGALGTAMKMGFAFLWLLKILKPITFFGWLMLTAGCFLLLIYKFVRLYVQPKLYWLAIFILMMNVEFAPLMINSNRQCISMIFVMIGVLFLLNQFHIALLAKKWSNYLFAAVFFFLGAQCHSIAYISFLIIPIYWLSQRYNCYNWILAAIVCNFIFIGRLFLDVTWIQNYAAIASAYLNIGDVDLYLDWIDNELISTSITYTAIYCVIITMVCYYYREQSPTMKFFSICWIIGFMISSYFTGNINRIGEYFYIYFLYLLPAVFSISFKHKGNLRLFASLFLVVYLGYGIGHSWTQMHSEYYERWLDYKSVFDAPQWE